MSDEQGAAPGEPDLVGEWVRFLSHAARPLSEAASGSAAEGVLRTSHDALRRLASQLSKGELFAAPLARTGELAAGLRSQIEGSLQGQLASLRLAREPDVAALAAQVQRIDERLAAVEGRLEGIEGGLRAIAAAVGADGTPGDDADPAGGTQ